MTVLVVFFLVLNWVFIWPHFSDWADFSRRGDLAAQKLATYQKVIAQAATYQNLVRKLEGDGGEVAPEDEGIDFTRTIQTQSYASGVSILNTSRQITSTNDQFFVEQVLNVNVQGNDDQLVDFLYKLGSGPSMIRVRGLELQPDAPHQHLSAQIRLVASYSKSSPAPLNSVNAIAK